MQEVKYLKTQERKKIADKLSQFRDSVDLAEDASYTDILQEQADLESKILILEETLGSASIIKEKKSSVIRIGSNIALRKIGDRKEIQLKLVGAIDADPQQQMVSNESPIGKALLGRKKDEIVIVTTVVGDIKYRIIRIK